MEEWLGPLSRPPGTASPGAGRARGALHARGRPLSRLHACLQNLRVPLTSFSRCFSDGFTLVFGLGSACSSPGGKEEEGKQPPSPETTMCPIIHRKSSPAVSLLRVEVVQEELLTLGSEDYHSVFRPSCWLVLLGFLNRN